MLLMSKNMQTPARLVLLLATVIWGSSFVILKNTLDSLPVMFIMSVRFLGACIILSAVFPKKLKMINSGYTVSGAVAGLLLFLAYYTQTVGLSCTTPSKNAFLTSVYCIIVPFLFWAVDKKRPDRYNIIAAIMCLTGIGLVSLTDSLTVEIGDCMTLVSGFFFAAHIIVIAKLTRSRDSVLITILQFFFCGIFSAMGAALFEAVPGGRLVGALPQMLYLTVLCTAVALLCQNWGQAHLPPSNAAILLSLESVFGTIFSVIIYHETLTPQLMFGFCLIFAATTISETKLEFLKKSSVNVKNTTHS